MKTGVDFTVLKLYSMQGVQERYCDNINHKLITVKKLKYALKQKYNMKLTSVNQSKLQFSYMFPTLKYNKSQINFKAFLIS